MNDIPVKLLDDAESIFAGNTASFTIKRNQTYWGWGANSHN